MGKAPCSPFAGFGASRGGVSVTPGLEERTLDQAQDDSMGKKCPHEEYCVSTAKTACLSRSHPPYLPASRARGVSTLCPLGRAPTRRGTLFTPTPLPRNLTISVSHCLCLFISHSLSLSPSPTTFSLPGPHSATEPLPCDRSSLRVVWRTLQTCDGWQR